MVLNAHEAKDVSFLAHFKGKRDGISVHVQPIGAIELERARGLVEGIKVAVVYVFPTAQWRKYGRPLLGGMHAARY